MLEREIDKMEAGREREKDKKRRRDGRFYTII
jgi:hypothetical protein